MSTEAAPSTPAAPAVPPVIASAPPPPAAPAAPQTLEETFNNMPADKFKARLAEAAESGQKSLLAALGMKSQDEVKAALLSFKEMQDAKLTTEEKTRKQLDELTPRAAKAEQLEEQLKKYLDLEEKAIPEDKKGLLKLAPTDPAARLDWIATAKAEGLFASVAAPAPIAPKVPATTIAPPGPAVPPPAGTTGVLEQYQQYITAGQTRLAANFYAANRTSIDAARKTASSQ